jgi:hypothetical protein
MPATPTATSGRRLHVGRVAFVVRVQQTCSEDARQIPVSPAPLELMDGPTTTPVPLPTAPESVYGQRPTTPPVVDLAKALHRASRNLNWRNRET